ncbi:ATP-binding protein [Desulfobotulus sp. H1]|uniref:ATP-binding protein n=1 Tax=Desulfobotulus pelophilus TaxID=2823377 RepID=A0ABT3N8S3_9BACT|nr:ATP-binding protein [Desulfobotulus pelophilus]MCW7753853.1 ATP-binding protein [Desulfobotulus pelophilus]
MNDMLFIAESNETQTQLSIRMSANMDNIERANKETMMFLRVNQLNSINFAICLGMREALTNAVRHGNRTNPSGIITYRIHLTNQRIILEIIDEGPGFDWKEPLIVAPDAENGRGIQIMRNYFQSIRYNEKGNHLILEKDLPHGSGPRCP